MFVACLQMQPGPAMPQANLAQILSAARAAAAAGARLLVTPEMSVSGYAIWDKIPQFAQERDSEYVAALQHCSEETGIAIVAGFPERAYKDIYNTCVFVASDGERHFYRKCHLFGPHEKVAFEKGE
jgi:predicted amidohydrolase